NLLGWICFAIAAVTYILTLEPTTSLWDSGEFIAAAYKMQIVHQPGAPLFLMIENIMSNFAMGDITKIAYCMNMGSALSSVFTIILVIWHVIALSKQFLANKRPSHKLERIRINGRSAVGALVYTFSGTFWFSTVDTEFYAIESLSTVIVYWALLQWEAQAYQP